MSRPQSPQTEAILKACLEGHKVATVAKLLGLTRTNVYHVLQKHGIKLADLPRMPVVPTPITYRGEIRAGDKFRRIGMPSDVEGNYFVWGFNGPSEQSIEMRSYAGAYANKKPLKIILSIERLRESYEMQTENPVGTLLVPKMSGKCPRTVTLN